MLRAFETFAAPAGNLRSDARVTAFELRCLAPLLLCGCALGCTLVDQRTFERTAKGPSQPDLARVARPSLPLVTIRFDRPDYDFRPDLGEAVDAAQSRKPDVAFEVVAVLPIDPAKPVDSAKLREGQTDAAEVATALASDGVPPDRVHLALRGDPGAPPPEVLVYVR